VVHNSTSPLRETGGAKEQALGKTENSIFFEKKKKELLTSEASWSKRQNSRRGPKKGTRRFCEKSREGAGSLTSEE
jgi:hypothetical protein